MRVLHVIPFLSAKDGGPSVAVRQMATQVQQHHNVEMVLVATDAEGKGRANVPLSTPITQDGLTYWYFRRQTAFYTVSLPLGQWLKNHIHQFSVVHIHGLFSYANTAAAWYAYHAGVPYIVRPFGVLNEWGFKYRRPLLKQLSMQFVERQILRHAAVVQYTSLQEQEEAEKLGGKTPSVILPLAIDFRLQDTRSNLKQLFYASYPELQGHPLLLYLSRFHPIKGIDLLLPAFRKVLAERPDARLVLAGDGEVEFIQRLRTQADQLQLNKQVYWTGFLKGTMKQAALSAADMFVLPSYSESFGIAVVEALAAGTSVIISDRVAIHREIEAAGAGTVVPCDVDALAAGLLDMLANPAQRIAQATAGQRLASETFSTRAMADGLFNLYTQVANRRGG